MSAISVNTAAHSALWIGMIGVAPFHVDGAARVRDGVCPPGTAW